MTAETAVADPTLLQDPILRPLPAIRGYKVLGPCVIRRLIGRGGMGGVYHAQHLNLGIEVAVKCLLPQLLATDSDASARFQREAVLSATTSHPNLVRVFDVGEQHGLHYMVMELVVGETLRGRVRRRATAKSDLTGSAVVTGLEVREALTLALRAAEGLAAAHAAGIVHRDIKPDNILISATGVVKVADLGLAKCNSPIDSVATSTRLAMGTPSYMPPEQFDSAARVGPTADVYSLAMTLAYLLIGDDVFNGSTHEILGKVCLQPFPDLHLRLPHVPEDVVDLIVGAAAKIPEQRPLDADRFAGEIRAVLERHGGSIDLADANAIAASAVRGSITPLPVSALSEIKRLQVETPGTWAAAEAVAATLPPLERPRRRPLLWAGAAMLLALAGGGAAYVASVLRPDDVGAAGATFDIETTRRRLADPTTHEAARADLSRFVDGNPDHQDAKSLLVHVCRADAESLERSGCLSDAFSLAKLALRSADDETSRRLVARLQSSLASTLAAALRVEGSDPMVVGESDVELRGTLDHASVDRILIGGSAATRTGSQFSARLKLADGPHDVQVQVHDRSGLIVPSQRRVLVDTTAPRLAIVSPQPGIVPRNVTVEVAVSDSTHVEISILGEVRGTVEPQAKPVSFSVMLDPETTSIVVAARDGAGHVSEQRIAVTVDAEPPTVTVENAQTLTWTKDSRARIRGTALDGDRPASLTVGGTLERVDAEGRFEVFVALPNEGRQEFELVATDRVGNAARQTVAFCRDTTPPRVQVTAPMTGARLRPGLLSVAAKVEDEGVTECTLRGTAVPVVDGCIEGTIEMAHSGNWMIDLVAVDQVGNRAVVEIPVLVLEPCVACHSSGKCTTCSGAGSKSVSCQVCGGRGEQQTACGTCLQRGAARCARCSGLGIVPTMCTNCHGEKRIKCNKCLLQVRFQGATLSLCSCLGTGKVTCDGCRGTGKGPDEDCRHCQLGFVIGTQCGACSGRGWHVTPCSACLQRKTAEPCTSCQSTGKCRDCNGQAFVNPR